MAALNWSASSTQLGQEVDLRTDRQHLPSLAGAQLRNGLQGLLLGARQMIAVAHAEGIVDRHSSIFCVRSTAAERAIDERIRKRQRDQISSADPQRQQSR